MLGLPRQVGIYSCFPNFVGLFKSHVILKERLEALLALMIISLNHLPFMVIGTTVCRFFFSNKLFAFAMLDGIHSPKLM